MKYLFAFLFVILAATQAPLTTTAHAQTAQAKLPTEAEVDTALKRTFGYNKAITWRIVMIRPSAMPGVADVIVSMNQDPPQHMYVSSDGKHVLIGEMAPWGNDPFQPARAKLAGAQGIDRGPADATVTLYVFTDLQCADCKASQPIYDKLATDFPQMRQVFMPVPLPVHPWSMQAAKYADCLGRADKPAFWPYLNAVFKSQDIIATDATNQLKAMIPAADAANVAACVADPATEKRIAGSIELSQVIELDVDQLPTAYLNGRKMLNAATIPYDRLKALVQFEFANAGK